MKFLLRHRGLLVVTAAVVLTLVLAVVSLVSGGASPVSNALNVLLKPVQSFFSGIVGSVEELYRSRYDYDALKAENEQMRVRIAELEKAEREYRETLAENERLKELLDVRTDRPELKFEIAKIVTRDASSFARTFTIDQGQRAGIEVGDCAVSSELYLAGIVTEVGYNWATLISLIDTDIQIGARVFRTGQSGVAEGDFSLMRQGKLALTYLPVDADIQNGDVVMTSGAGGLYPKDIPIGRVRDLQTESSGISARAVLAPLAELDRLTQVFVVTGFTGEDEEDMP